MARLGTRTLVLTVGGTNYAAQVSNVEIDTAASDSDFVTFADAAAGGATAWTLKFTAEQNMATGTLWDTVWSSAGTSVAILVKPYGNTTASTTQPHYSANATVVRPSGTFIGGDADSSTTAAMTFDCEWPLDAQPTKVTS